MYAVKQGDIIFKEFTVVETKEVNDEKGIIVHKITQQSPDLDREIVWLDGTVLSPNLVVLWAHGREGRGRVPIGKMLSVKTEGDGLDKSLVATTQFTFSEIPEDEESKFYFKLYKFNYMKGWSIGFGVNKVMQGDEARKFLVDNGIPAEAILNVDRVLVATIHEYSGAPIPANPAATTITVDGQAPKAHENCLFKTKAVELEAEIKTLREELAELKGTHETDDTVIEGEDKALWDTAYINSLPDAAFAVIEPAYKRGDTENKAARHLPHHGKDVKNGDILDNLDMPHFRNALARMSQIKPVTDSITTADLRAKAEAHLNKHKKQLEKKDLEAPPSVEDFLRGLALADKEPINKEY